MIGDRKKYVLSSKSHEQWKLFDRPFQAATLVKGFDMHPSLQFCSFPFNCTLSMIPKNGKQQYMTASPFMQMRLYLSFYDFL